MCGTLKCLERKVSDAARSTTFTSAFLITFSRHSATSRFFHLGFLLNLLLFLELAKQKEARS